MRVRFRKRVLVTCVYIVAISLSGCADDGPTLSRLAPGAKILAFGDSLTHGTGSTRGEDYPTVLARLSGREVINSGTPGEVSADGLKRLEGILDSIRPSLMILCHGGNDMLRKKDLSKTQQNLVRMIELAKGKGIDVLLVGVPKPGLLLGTADFYEEVAELTGVPSELDVVADILSKAQFKSDPVHPNARGYTLMAESIFDVLKRTGAI